MVSMKKKTSGFYQQLYETDAHDFQWCQHQWKIDMRNRTLRYSKKIELAFEIGLAVHDTRSSKTTKKKCLFST